MTQYDDLVLLEKIQQGEHCAFAELVNRHTTRFYRLAFRYVSQKESAEDIVQRAFLKLWEKPDHWQAGKGAQFTTWFSRIIINLCLDMRKKRVPLLLAEKTPDLADDDQDQLDNIISAQEKVQLEHAIGQLPERQQTALNLCFYEEETIKHAAEIMQVTPKAVESLLMRAKANLRSSLAEYKRKEIAS